MRPARQRAPHRPVPSGGRVAHSTPQEQRNSGKKQQRINLHNRRDRLNSQALVHQFDFRNTLLRGIYHG